MTEARTTFHHGNLREAALAAALAVVEGEGASALSLRGLAASLGVNHRALYRHFTDLNDLSTQVAAEGFRLMARDLGPQTGAQALMRGYLRFAFAHPHLYAHMFARDGADFLHHPVLAPAVRLVTDLADAAFRTQSDPPGFSPALRDRVMRAWGLAHGLIDLSHRGALRARNPVEAEAYIAGLLAGG